MLKRDLQCSEMYFDATATSSLERIHPDDRPATALSGTAAFTEEQTNVPWIQQTAKPEGSAPDLRVRELWYVRIPFYYSDAGRAPYLCFQRFQSTTIARFEVNILGGIQCSGLGKKPSSPCLWRSWTAYWSIHGHGRSMKYPHGIRSLRCRGTSKFHYSDHYETVRAQTDSSFVHGECSSDGDDKCIRIYHLCG